MGWLPAGNFYFFASHYFPCFNAACCRSKGFVKEHCWFFLYVSEIKRVPELGVLLKMNSGCLVYFFLLLLLLLLLLLATLGLGHCSECWERGLPRTVIFTCRYNSCQSSLAHVDETNCSLSTLLEPDLT